MSNLGATFKNIKGINIAFAVIAVVLVIAGLIVAFSPSGLMAQDASQGTVQASTQNNNGLDGSAAGMAFLAAGLALGISVIGAAIALAKIGSAAVASIAERPEITGRVIVFAGLAEGLAIWGLIVAVLILGKI